MNPLAELQESARELAVVSHVLGVKIQGHDLRLACVEAAAAALALRWGAHPNVVAACAAAIARCHREIESRLELYAKTDPEGCRELIATADARIASLLGSTP